MKKSLTIFLILTFGFTLVLASSHLIIPLTQIQGVEDGASSKLQVCASAPPLSWMETYDNSDPNTTHYYGKDVAVDGNYIYVAGHNYTGVDYEVTLIKYDSSGTLVKAVTWNDTGDEAGYGVAVDSANSVYVTGWRNSGTSSNDVFLLKYDINLDQVWNRTWSSGGVEMDRGYAVATDSENNIYVGGYAYNSSVGNRDALLMKYNSNGDLLWNKTWGGITGDDEGRGVAVDGDYVYLTGYTPMFGAQQTFLIKYDRLTGNRIWNESFGGTLYDRAYDVAVDSSHNVYIAGVNNSPAPVTNEALVVKYDANGNYLWNRTYGGIMYTDANGIAIDDNDRIYVTGSIQQPILGVTTDLFVACYNSDGDLLWYEQSDYMYSDQGNSIAISDQGDIYVAGEFQNGVRWRSMLLKYVLPSGGIPSFQLIWVVLSVTLLLGFVVLFLKSKLILHVNGTQMS